MKKRRFWRQAIALGLSVVLAIGCGLPAVKAQDNMEAELEGSAPEERKILTISSASELCDFVWKVNSGSNYKGKIVKLTKDIEFDGTVMNNFPMIGNSNTRFEGTFDGEEHTISGINIDVPDTGSAALFDRIGTAGTVKNVTIRDSYFRGWDAAGIAIMNCGRIANCHIRSTQVISTGVDNSAGGIASYSEPAGDYGPIIQNCSSEAVVEAEVYAGGIAGKQGYSGGIYNCCNWGSVTGEITGGIVAVCARITVQNCYNAGEVAGGGIADEAGYLAVIEDCYCAEESAYDLFESITGSVKGNEQFPASYMKSADFVSKLNENRGSHSDWLEWELRADSEYPQLKALTDLSGCTVTLSADRFGCTGKEIKPGVTVKLGGKILTEGVDYSVLYQNNVKKGRGQAIVLGEGIYKGSATKNFTIEGQKQVISCGTYYKKSYGSSSFQLNASLKQGNGELSYRSSNEKVAAVDAKGSVTVKGTGRAVIRVTAAATDAYEEAEVKVTVDVRPKKQTAEIKSGKAVTVKWKKDTQADGYQVQYGTSKKLSQSGKIKTIQKRSQTSVKLKKLKKKTYYVRVRSFKKIDEKVTLYGPWSKIKKAQYNEKKKAYTVTGQKAPKLSASSVSLKAGETKKIQLKNITGSKKIKWSTSKKKVASIKANGAKVTITAKKAGTAAVTASYRGKKYKCTVTVQAKEKTKALPYRSLGVSDFTSAGKEKVGQWYFTEKWENNGAQGGGWVLRYSKKKGKEGTVIVRNYAGAVTNGTLLYYGVHTGERFGSNCKLKVYRYNLSSGKCREVETIPYANQLEGLYNGKYYVSGREIDQGWGESYVYDPKTKRVSRLYDAILRGSYRNYIIISTAGDTYGAKELIVYNAKTKKFSMIEQEIMPDACRVVGRYVYYIAQKPYDTGREYLQFYRYDLLTGTRKLLSPEKFIFTYGGYITEWTEDHACYKDDYESGNISRIVFK